eukprot:2739311-Amphidinium_carterae.1
MSHQSCRLHGMLAARAHHISTPCAHLRHCAMRTFEWHSASFVLFEKLSSVRRCVQKPSTNCVPF